MTKPINKPSQIQSKESKFGQIIGEAFAKQLVDFTSSHLATYHPDFILVEPDEGKKQVRLKMLGGTSRQIDNVIRPENSLDPIALFETKWLKDARHHNDKGAWILQLREVQKNHPTIRGSVANLAGYWTEGVSAMFMSEGGVYTVHVATDEEIYSTLQPVVNSFCQRNLLPPLTLNAKEFRKRLPRAEHLSDALRALSALEMASIAATWLNFPKTASDGTSSTGGGLVTKAIDILLDPLPLNPKVAQFEISLKIDTGNIIYQKFEDLEEALEFVKNHATDPTIILDKITPKIISRD